MLRRELIERPTAGLSETGDKRQYPAPQVSSLRRSPFVAVDEVFLDRRYRGCISDLNSGFYRTRTGVSDSESLIPRVPAVLSETETVDACGETLLEATWIWAS